MELNFSFTRPEDSPGFMLWRLTAEWQRRQRTALKSIGLTHPQFVVLACMLWLSKKNNDTITQQSVATLSQIDKMTVSDIVLLLTKKKLVVKKRHSQDKRAFTLQLTKKGQELVVKAIPIVEKIDKEFFSQEHKRVNDFAKLVIS